MTRRHCSPLFVLALLFGVTAIVAHGQAPGIFLPSGIPGSDTPVFRTGAEAVAIDVFVTDAAGNPVSGLTLDDFELDENGKRQDITTFRAVNLPFDVDERDRPLAEPDVASNEDPEGRVYVIANAIGVHANAVKARAFLRRFLDRHFGPHDMAAVVTGRGLATDGQDFTSNRRLLQTAIDKLGTGGGLTDPRDLRDVLDVLARIPGRHKSFIYLSEGSGFPWSALIDYRGGVGSMGFDWAHAAMGFATRNNITIYPINPQGLMAPLNMTSDAPLTVSGVESLEIGMNQRVMAEMTGGFAHLSSNDFDSAFERIVRDASTYYMLGFNSDYRKNDGKFVRLNVRVKRPGLVVRTRSGYISATRREQQAAARTATKVRPPIVEALSNPLTAAGHPIRATAAAFKGAGDDATIILTVETSLVMQDSKPRADARVGRIDIRMIATGASRRVFPEIRVADRMTMPAKVSELTADRVRLVTELALPKGRHQIRVASGSDRIAGNVLYDLEVPDFTDRPLMMSGLVIGTGASDTLPTVQAANNSKKVKTRQCYEPSCPAAEVRDVPVTQWSAKTLVATHPLYDALPAPPTTVREFRQADTLTVFTEVYDNKGGRPVQVRAELRQPERAAVLSLVQDLANDKPRASGGYGVTLWLPLAAAQPGSYVLHVEARSTAGNAVTSRQIPIHIR